MVDYVDPLMSEYAMPRMYAIWALPFSAGVKLITAITSRYSGKDQLEERFREKMLESLATMQNELNELKS